MSYFAGVDLGATNLRAAVADGEGSVIGTYRRATPRVDEGIRVTEAVLDALRTACERTGIRPAEVDAAGVGSIGPLDLAEGAAVNPSNLPDEVDRVPLVGPVEELVGSGRVHLHNDTVAGVIGERFYSDRNPDDMVYLTISTGIGAGVCVDGRVLAGWDGNAGEVGHFTVDPEGRMRCGCGNDGHWEAYCSGENLPAYARYLAGEGEYDTDLALDDPEFDAADVFAHAGEDALADRVIDRVAHWNVRGVATLVHAFAPLIVRVGGAVALNNESLVVGPIRERLEETLMVNVPDVERTTLGEDVVLRGAVASAITGGTGRVDRTG